MKKNLAYSFITVVFIAFIATASSCLKKQNLESDDLGTALSGETVGQTLADAFGGFNYDEIKPNDRSSIILTQTVQEGNPQALEQQDVTIKKITNTSSALDLELFSKMITYSGLQNTENIREWTKNFTKYGGYAFSSLGASNSEISEPLFLFQIIQNLALGSCYNEGDFPETCHNLISTPIQYKVPSASAYQHQCQDLYNCYIPATKVEFDLVKHYELESDGKPKRIHYKFILSPNVPFTSRVLQYCTRSLYDIQGVPQKVLADICYSVNNYTFGN